MIYLSKRRKLAELVPKLRLGNTCLSKLRFALGAMPTFVVGVPSSPTIHAHDKRGHGTRGPSWRIILATLLLTVSAGLCRAEDDAKLDWGTWQRLPVFVEGRVSPLDTFARETVEAICGRPDPTLAIAGRERPPVHCRRVAFSWLAEPEKWERRPFWWRRRASAPGGVAAAVDRRSRPPAAICLAPGRGELAPS